MVSKIVRRTLPILQLLAKSKPAQARQILKNANSDLVESLRQCVLNVLRGVVSLTPKQHKQLARYKRRLRKLVDSKTKIKDRKVIIQKGANFLLPLLGALIPQIVGGIASLIKNKQQKKNENGS